MGLRDYQTTLIDRLRQRVGAGVKHPLVCAPTGSGKTLLAATVTKNAKDKGRRVVLLSPRRELVKQTSAALTSLGVNHGVIMAGEPHSALASIYVVCTPTLHARAVKREKIRIPDADVVISDECHLDLAPTRVALLEKFPNAVRIGFTATPARGDGRGLGTIYDEIVMGPTVAELTEMGHLVPVRYFCPPKFDTEGVAIVKGDYAQKQLGERVDTNTLIGDVVSNWQRIAPDRQTVVFAVTQAHARHLQEAFQAAGVRTGYVDSETENDERAQVLKDFAEKRLQVICNCMVLSYGWDCPSASCAVLARPTKSIVMYLQSAGRILRPCDGKDDAIVIDHGGIVDELGFIDDPIAWTLDGNANIGKTRMEAVKEQSKGVTCGQCQCTFKYAPTCPQCGWHVPPKPGKNVETVEAQLEEMTKAQRKLQRDWTPEQKRQFYAELLTYSLEKGYSQGWASNKYRERTGVWPNAHKDARPVPVSPETASWIRAMNIRWAKSKHNPRNAA